MINGRHAENKDQMTALINHIVATCDWDYEIAIDVIINLLGHWQVSSKTKKKITETLMDEMEKN